MDLLHDKQNVSLSCNGNLRPANTLHFNVGVKTGVQIRLVNGIFCRARWRVRNQQDIWNLRMDEFDAITAPSLALPTSKLIWTAIVDVGPRSDLGPSRAGHRYIVPILGGCFRGGPDNPEFSGIVLPGGADRQLVRMDGIKELDALYEMQTTDGSVIIVRNRVVVDEERKPDRYAMSVISVTVPIGAHDWLNRRLIIGTLHSLRPARQSVVVRAWEVDC